MVYNDPVQSTSKEKHMKTLVRLAINGLALVGAVEIYKEYTSQKNSKTTSVGSLDDQPPRLFDRSTS